jgi:heme exporter protein D
MSNICISDGWQMLPVLAVVDYVIYFSWCLHTNALFHSFAMGFNFSFFSVFLFQYFAPARMPDGPVNHVFMHVAFLLFFVYVLQALGDGIALTLVMLLLGPVWNSARTHIADWIGVDGSGWPIVSITLFLFLVSLFCLYRCRQSKAVRRAEEQVMCSMCAAIATSALFFQGGVAAEWNGDAEYCPFVFDAYAIVALVMFIMLRVIGRRKCSRKRRMKQRQKKKKGKNTKQKQTQQLQYYSTVRIGDCSNDEEEDEVGRARMETDGLIAV